MGPIAAARAIAARAAAGTGSALGLELERHLAVLIYLGVQRLVVEGGSRIGLDEHVHVGFLDDLVAGLRAVRQRQCQPAGAAVFGCDAQPVSAGSPGCEVRLRIATTAWSVRVSTPNS